VSVAGTEGVEREHALRGLAKRRWRIAITLTAAMVAIYFGFVSLIAFDKAFLARQITPGLSVGILLGVLVIVSTWLLTWAYVRWANERYDPELEKLRR
jgi:uncharacterized membrane protein (DUF485 family)